jgi:hypothetical protein
MIILYIYVYIIHNIYQGKNTCPKDKRHPLTQLIHIRGYTHRYIYIYIYLCIPTPTVTSPARRNGVHQRPVR